MKPSLKACDDCSKQNLAVTEIQDCRVASWLLTFNNNWPLTVSDVIYNHNIIWNYKLHDHAIELQITNYTKTNCNL